MVCRSVPHAMHLQRVMIRVIITWMGLNPPLKIEARKREKPMGDCTDECGAQHSGQSFTTHTRTNRNIMQPVGLFSNWVVLSPSEEPTAMT